MQIDSQPVPMNQVVTITQLRYVCTRCGYSWSPRVSRPRSCPKCHNEYWNRPRKYFPRSLWPKLAKITDEEEVRNIARQLGMEYANFFTIERLQNRIKQHERNMKRKAKQLQEAKNEKHEITR